MAACCGGCPRPRCVDCGGGPSERCTHHESDTADGRIGCACPCCDCGVCRRWCPCGTPKVTLAA